MSRNRLDAKAAEHLAGALKENKTLTTLKYAADARFSYCQHPLTKLVLCLLPTCSLDDNNLTNDGEDMSSIIQFANALEQNSSLTSLSCVPPT